MKKFMEFKEKGEFIANKKHGPKMVNGHMIPT
jgi:hypothetical protein